MASTLNASSSGSGGLIASGDASGVLQLQSNGVTTATVDTSGNLGLGVTPSAWGGTGVKALDVAAATSLAGSAGSADMYCNTYFNGTNFVFKASGYAGRYSQNVGVGYHAWYVSNNGTAGGTPTFTQAMTLDASGNLGLGVTPSAWPAQYRTIESGISGANYGVLWTSSNSDGGLNSYGQAGLGNNNTTGSKYAGTGAASYYLQSGGRHSWWNAPSGTAGNAITFTQLMTLDAGGNLLLGTTDATASTGVGVKVLASATIPALYTVFNIPSAGNAYHLYNTNATNNGYRFYVGVNGGISNYSANNTNLSDIRSKTDVKDAGDYLSKICAIPVRTFKYKDQSNDDLNLGVIAQEVEAIAPELVCNDGFGDTPEDGIPLKTIYQTDLQYALMKCIQEQQALITSLTARLDAAGL